MSRKSENLFSYFRVNGTLKWTHGGTRVKGKRKERRNLIPGKWTHVTLKSSKAYQSLSFFRHKKLVAGLLGALAKKYGVEIREWVNMGNHLHLKVRFYDKVKFQNFLRTYAALLARKITGAVKGKGFGKFWDGLAFTRVLTTRFEELQLTGYFQANREQRDKGYQARKAYLKKFNAWVCGLRRKKGSSRDTPTTPPHQGQQTQFFS